MVEMRNKGKNTLYKISLIEVYFMFAESIRGNERSMHHLYAENSTHRFEGILALFKYCHNKLFVTIKWSEHTKAIICSPCHCMNYSS